MSKFLRRTAFNLAYLFKPRWDSGIPAPELIRFIAGKTPGNAIDIGCGTGTNVLYLAQHDWRVTGVDFAPRAIARARRKTRDYRPTLLVADAVKLAGYELPGPYELGLDMGCIHSLSGTGRQAYVKGVEKWIKPQGVMMIYAFQPSETSPAKGITREEMISYFKESFELIHYEQGRGRPSAWYYFRRR